MSTEKATYKRLTFLPGEDDQRLLERAEQTVEAGDFSSFNDLCKAALQSFLLPAESTSAAEQSRLAQFARIGERLDELLSNQQQLQAQMQRQSDELLSALASGREQETEAQVEQETSAPNLPTEEIMNRLVRYLEEF